MPFFKAGLRRFSHLCLITDSTAAFYATLEGRASSQHPVFLRLLRRIWRVTHQYGISLSLALTTSAANAADAPSRLHQLPPALMYLKSTDISALNHPFPLSSVVPRFWYRSGNVPMLRK